MTSNVLLTIDNRIDRSSQRGERFGSDSEPLAITAHGVAPLLPSKLHLGGEPLLLSGNRAEPCVPRCSACCRASGTRVAARRAVVVIRHPPLDGAARRHALLLADLSERHAVLQLLQDRLRDLGRVEPMPGCHRCLLSRTACHADAEHENPPQQDAGRVEQTL